MIDYCQSDFNGMELLLNLVWVALALMALSAFQRRRRCCTWTARVPYLKALLALACTLVLLFPVVSASDDLHPTQAVFEDASKRIHQFVSPLQQGHISAPLGTLPALLAIYLLSSLLVLKWRRPDASAARVLVRERLPRIGRSPPSL